MKITADLHVHSRFARATSNKLDIPTMEKFARLKGVSLLGTGDFTHPAWQKELRRDLIDDGSGIYKTKTGFPFMCTTEISLIYTQAGKGRRIHNIVWAPSLDVVDQITEELLKHGRVDYDGRPIFNIPCDEFVSMLRRISPAIEVIPAHIFTPWFAMFGSMSGFDSVKECFGNQEKHIHAYETGLSADPTMTWRLSQLDKYSIVSFSDLHSHWPWRMGREATIFDVKKLTYKNIINCLRNHENIVETLEFFPEEGKYHMDGHRKCGVCLTPSESLAKKNMCPKCGKKLTLGVAHRVEQLADRPEGYTLKNAVPFRYVIPLSEMISAAYGGAFTTKKHWTVYNKIVNDTVSEMDILFTQNVNTLDINDRLKALLLANRAQKISFSPGFDGQYGKPIFDSFLKDKPLKKGLK
jgi:uncharacterized protein (TIGR00375 family)